jgi:hypothetical protein
MRPFFAAASGATSGADHRAIDAPQLRLRLDADGPQAIQDLLPTPFTTPLIKESPSRLPRTKLCRQVSPRGARAHDPQDAVHHSASIGRRTTRRRSWRKQVLDRQPLLVRQKQPCHRMPSLLKLKANSVPLNLFHPDKKVKSSSETEPSFCHLCCRRTP